MRISVVVENSPSSLCREEHGLSLWVEACRRRFFFDLGQGALFATNAKALGIDVREAEFAIISHGHYDHGGGIGTFLQKNALAPVYLSDQAFGNHYSLKDGRPRYIGLDKSLKDNKRLVLLKDDVRQLSPGLTLFHGCLGSQFFSPANGRILKGVDGEMMADDFSHEQSLVIEEGARRVLIAGCAHLGILNIMAKAEAVVGAPLTDVVAGMHLQGVQDEAFVDALAQALLQHDCDFYTCHCTGEEAFARLQAVMGRRIRRIGSGDVLRL